MRRALALLLLGGWVLYIIDRETQIATLTRELRQQAIDCTDVATRLSMCREANDQCCR